ncbi:carbon-nitrogen hydrolase [Choiromyces venosus 120613-1]|uniref:Carbon-nitrogen hydrolase n=1 Tax=Choiromyces venosus 120613-1 TaxID=1336337 RepID=A0A3N4JGF7_9PEZI|nr:carbon-nitrogen hydrolase [Choiromyces venosus 120613-1]
MPPLKLTVAQYATCRTRAETLTLLREKTTAAAETGTNLILFPEAFLGGYPRGSAFNAVIGDQTDTGRKQYHEYWTQAVDLGDTHPDGLGRYDAPGDGTREFLEGVARDTGVFLVVGVVEKVGATLFCGVVFVCPKGGIVGKRRKVMPTGAERVVWGIGSPKTLKAVKSEIAGQKVTLGAAISWENYMPLLRATLYTQNTNIYLAPTADARESWISTMRHIALEGRCYVLGCNQFVTDHTLPAFANDVAAEAGEEVLVEEEEGEEILCDGGSVVFDPMGKLLTSPLFGEGMLSVVVEDLESEVVRAKMDFDTGLGGHYSRGDAFKLEVTGLEL